MVRKPVVLNLSSEMARHGNLLILYFTRCCWQLTTTLFANVQAVCESTSSFLFSFTICRLFAISVLLPIYCLQLGTRLLPTILANVWYLIVPCHKLLEATETYRRQIALQTQLQLEGKYIFPDDELVRVDRSEKRWMNDIFWHDQVEQFLVCGARVRFIHLKPTAPENDTNGCAPKRPIVLLHGCRSWSYIWRKVLPKLLKEGHELYALDWLGYGRSDKPICRESITFELHMQTLSAFVNHVNLRDAILVAHSWGGYVALCTIPTLPSSSCSGLFLINPFLPAQPRGMSANSCLLYGAGFLLTEVLSGYVPESTIMRFISPHIAEQDVEGYGAPYQHLPANARSSREHFSHMAPGTPHFVLRRLRETLLWKLCEAICDPRNFRDLNALALLSERDDNMKRYWQKQKLCEWDESQESALKTAVLFGKHDPLLKDYKEIILRVIGKEKMVNWAPNGIWLEGAGHYPMEDKPDDVAGLISRFS